MIELLIVLLVVIVLWKILKFSISCLGTIILFLFIIALLRSFGLS